MLLAGTAKIRRPAATADSLALSGLPDSPAVARLLGVGEVVLGAAVLVTGHVVVLAAQAVAYLVFAVVSARLLRTGQGSCGCFGEVDAPLSRLHVVVNLVLGVGTIAAGATNAVRPDTLAQWLVAGAVVAAGAALVRMLLVLMPALADGLRRLEGA